METKNTYPHSDRPSETEDIQRILGNPPGWALRWGITAVLVGMILFLGLAWLIRYPDVVTAPVVILTENPPIRVVARADGKISQLLVADKEELRPGQLIAILENTADPKSIRQLEQLLSELDTLTTPAEGMQVRLPSSLRVGELQADYASFQQSLADFQFYESQQGVYAQITSLRQQTQYREDLIYSLEQQAQTLSREVAIAEGNLKRNRELHEKGTVSTQDLERAETVYLQTRRQLQELQSRVFDNKLQIEQLSGQIVDLDQNRSLQSMQKWLLVREQLRRLQSAFASWQQTYHITSPIAGRLSLTQVWGAQQFVQANEVVATVVPTEGPGQIIGRAFLPPQNAGKVQPGMRVNIRLDGYPYQEFGVVQGQVGEIALVPDPTDYLLEIDLPDTLVTTYQRTLPFTQELPGTARIITEDRRILERIFDQFLSLVSNN
jgi:multidrug resistance efflux pump